MTKLQVSALSWLFGGFFLTAALITSAAAYPFSAFRVQVPASPIPLAQVDMSWPESAGFLKIMPITPAFGPNFMAEEWGTLFGPAISSTAIAPPPAVGTTPVFTSPVPSPAGPPSTLGPAIPGSAPTQPAGPGKVTNLKQPVKKPGEWVDVPSSKASQIKVQVLEKSQSTAPYQPKSVIPIAGQTSPPPANLKLAAPYQLPVAVSGRIEGAYVSWTPGVIYVAGLVPTGSDLVVSLDTRATGQPFGSAESDFEVRIPSNGGAATLKQAKNGTLQELPGWEGLIKTSAVPYAQKPGYELIEGEIQDPTGLYFPQKIGGQFAIREDAVPTGVVTTLAGTRTLSLVETTISKGPNGLAGVQGAIEPGIEMVGVNQFTADLASTIKIKPKGQWPSYAKKIEVTPIGANATNMTSVSFNFGAGLANTSHSVPYLVLLQKPVEHGYGAFKINVSNGAEPGTNYYLPYRVVGPISIQSQSAVVHSTDVQQRIKIHAVLISNVRKSMRGVFNVGAPSGWMLDKGTDKSFVLYNINNRSVTDFMLTIPKGVQPGLYPLTLTATFDQRTVSHVTYVVVL